MEKSTFGERLAYARWWRAGMVRREADADFADAVGITPGLLSQWRERVDAIDTEKGSKIAQLCEVEFDWLMRGEGASTPAPTHFANFVKVYRDWVKRGGLRKSIERRDVKKAPVPKDAFTKLSSGAAKKRRPRSA